MGIRCNSSSDIARIVSKYGKYVNSATKTYPTVSPELVYAVMAWETCGHEVSNMKDPQGGAHGAMQILVGTARTYIPGITADQLMKKATNIKLGTRLLSELVKQYGSDAKTVYAHYNGGGDPPSISYTRGAYVKQLEKIFAEYLKSRSALATIGASPMKVILISISALAILGSIYIIVKQFRKKRR